MTLDQLKVAIDAWEDGYLTPRSSTGAARVEAVLDVPLELVAQLDPARQRNWQAMREGFGEED